VRTAPSPYGSTQSVYDALWQRFLDGSFSPGQRLLEVALAEELGVSRTPVREALGRFLAEGLVEPAARGVAVIRLDSTALEQLFEFRAELEGYAAQKAAERQSRGELAPVVIKDLETLVEDFAAAEGGALTRTATRTNLELHRGIVDAAGNPFLADTHRAIVGRLGVSMVSNLSHGEWFKSAARQHADLVAAIKAGAATQAREIGRQHILDALQVFRAENGGDR